MWGKANIDNMKKKCISLSDTILNLADTNIEYCWTLFKHGCTLIVAEEVQKRQTQLTCRRAHDHHVASALWNWPQA